MPNDLAMLAWAGTSYAMANAHPTVRAAADHLPRRTTRTVWPRSSSRSSTLRRASDDTERMAVLRRARRRASISARPLLPCSSSSASRRAWCCSRRASRSPAAVSRPRSRTRSTGPTPSSTPRWSGPPRTGSTDLQPARRRGLQGHRGPAREGDHPGRRGGVRTRRAGRRRALPVLHRGRAPGTDDGRTACGGRPRRTPTTSRVQVQEETDGPFQPLPTMGGTPEEASGPDKVRIVGSARS